METGARELFFSKCVSAGNGIGSNTHSTMDQGDQQMGHNCKQKRIISLYIPHSIHMPILHSLHKIDPVSIERERCVS